MADRHINMRGHEVRGVLDGRKTQHRLVLKPQPNEVDIHGLWYRMPGGGLSLNCYALPYQIGDRLWVRESFLAGIAFDENDMPTVREKIWYRATEPDLRWFSGESDSPSDRPPWRPSIHMPRWASRLTLTVTDVRVQRVQSISEDDADAEGVEYFCAGLYRDYLQGPDIGIDGARASFQSLWDSINAKRGHGWDTNPWVVALTFSVEQRNIDEVAA